ncbi:helix-turn-helix domain-containing protein [Nocardia salmonicida]|uniref:helix-turn-helix domain-containing protein n=1 Tax=Nocardia salmonicida TaxID=53431 RepID=UPI002E2BD7EC|nr:helix-turn-helix domain-containing protein [Nocardia salmonicida]
MNPSVGNSTQGRLSITAAQAAAILGVGLGTVNRWSLSGYLPSTQKGQRGMRPWLYDPETVEQLAVARREALAVLNPRAAA